MEHEYIQRDDALRISLPSSGPDQETLPALLSAGVSASCAENPQLVMDPAPWCTALAGITITEWADRRR